MLDVEIEELVELEEETLRQKLRDSAGRLQLRVFVSDLYESSSMSELADNWLKLWYLGERLAISPTSSNVYFRQTDDIGGGTVIYNFHGVDADRMASLLYDLAPAFDPNSGEATVFIYHEAWEWYQSRGDVPSQLPDLQDSFESDAAEARATEGYGPTRFDDIDDPETDIV